MKLTMTVLAASLLVIGCNKGDGLVVVKLSASPPITGVTSVDVTMTVRSTQRSHVISNLPTSTIASDFSFGIDVAANYGASIEVLVQALDASRHMLASGMGSGSIIAGQTTTIPISLRSSGQPANDMATQTPGDMNTADMSTADISTADLSGTATCTFDNQNTTLSNCVFAP
jgi:hypothetical protein